LLARHQAALTPEAMAVLRDYHWPGNVRELENVLERAAALAGASAIEPRHLLLDQAEAAVAAGRGTLKEQVAELERKVVAAALRKYGSTRRAGEALGLSHTSIRNKVKRYGLERYISNRKD